MMKLPPLLVVLVSVLECGLSARILAVFPFPGKSHDIFFSSVLRTLTEKGHQVVEYSPFPPSKPVPNHSHVEIHTSSEEEFNSWSFEQYKDASSDGNSLFNFVNVWFMTYSVCEDTFKHPSIRKLLNSNEHFDIIFIESTFGQESLAIFGEKFKAPVISLQAFGLWSVLKMDAGNELSIASIPELAAIADNHEMSFTNRFRNFISVLVTLAMYYLYHLPRHDQILKQYYREDVPLVADMVRNISLYLVNTHPAIEYAQPYTPNLVPIGGIIVSPQRSLMPKDLKKFMDEAEHGVIYFSFGTVVPLHKAPEEFIQIFVNVFKKMKQRVIWKIDTESIPGISKNVLLMKWVPQLGVLAHPKCQLFLTHGGLFGQLEALHAGVPTVGMPFFGDQPYNVRFSEHRGFGVKLDFNTLSEKTLTESLNTILDNPRYRENAQRLSRIFRDRPVSAADSVVFWVEYVLRHTGAHHLRPASTRLSWYQLALLDVLAVILIPIVIIFCLLYIFLRKVLCSYNKKNISVSKKSN